MIKLNYRNLIIFFLLFCVEVTIALYSKQGFIRAVFGDFLVVIMLYYFIAGFIQTKSIYIAIIVFIIAYVIEFLQLIDILSIIDYEKNVILNTILGTTFNTVDLIAYTLGLITVVLIEDRLKFSFN